jgi:hypothetical protein
MEATKKDWCKKENAKRKELSWTTKESRGKERNEKKESKVRGRRKERITKEGATLDIVRFERLLEFPLLI